MEPAMPKKKRLTEFKDSELVKRLFPKEALTKINSMLNPKSRKKSK